MTESKFAKYFLVFLLIIFTYLAFIVIFPVLKGIIFSLILVFAFYPAYNFLKKYLKNKTLTSLIMILLLLIIIIIPGSFVITSLINQSHSAYTFVTTYDFNKIYEHIPSSWAQPLQLQRYAGEIILYVKNFVVDYTLGFISSVAESFLGLFVMLFVMFYAFRDGEHWVKLIEDNLPLKKEYTKQLLFDTKRIVAAVLYGYILTAIIQGTLAGLIFFLLGIPNPIFWGFIMIILALVPFLGTAIIWVPVAIIEILSGHYFSGIALLILGFVVIMNIDNFIRPKLISKKSDVHPVIIFVGVIGGLGVFGFTGLILGPLILTLLLVIAKFFALEFQN